MSEPAQAPALVSPAAVRDTAGEFAELRQRYPEWARRFESDEPVYALPLPAIECLARSARANQQPPFDGPTADAERVYTRLCEANGVVGFRGTVPIAFPLLVTARTELSPLAGAFDWSPTQLAAVRGLLERGDETRRRLRGVIGWLLTEPAFMAQVAEVRHLFETLPSAHRPRFPLGRVLAVSNHTPEASLGAFNSALARLLDRWGLTQLASWELPAPQGPLLPDYLPAGAPARPAHGVWVYVPVHYPLRGDDELQQRVVEYQRQQVAALGIDPSFAGNTHHETYDRVFRLLHLERAMRSRFPTAPVGLVGRIETAATEVLGLSIERVQRLRKVISACRRGNRASVKELRVAH